MSTNRQTRDPQAALQNQAPKPIAATDIDRARFVIKHGRYFLVVDNAGAAPADNAMGAGLYADDTRFLSTWQMQLNGQKPVLLSANTEDGFAARYLYSNKGEESTSYDGERSAKPQDTVKRLQEQRFLIERNVVLLDGVFEEYKVTNYDVDEKSRRMRLTFSMGADFADMFEVRGSVRKVRGQALPSLSRVDAEGIFTLTLTYMGLDKILRTTSVKFQSTPGEKPLYGWFTGNTLTLEFELESQKQTTFTCQITTTGGATARPQVASASQSLSFTQAQSEAFRRYQAWRNDPGRARVISDNERFNQYLERSYKDLYMLLQPAPLTNNWQAQAAGQAPLGTCVAAGIPWFAVAFGRDQIVTALETLPFMSDIAKNVIDLLFAHLGKGENSFTEERPGRVMHELRLGEMANLREHPFVPYFGTVDATPLLLTLLGRYVEQTGDLDCARRHWSGVKSLLTYLQNEAASGYLVYGGQPGAALSNQGWKDSGDSIMYADGSMAQPPIALCEVQGYLFQAWQTGAFLADSLGEDSLARQLRSKAKALSRRFRKDFWMEDKSFVALALDGQGRQCDVVSSNAAHVLATDILSKRQKRKVARKLMSPEMFSGWGLRTLSTKEAAYNPLSYHNGTIWPHDNALAAWGLACAGEKHGAQKMLTAMLDVACGQSDMRLPELFSGFARTDAEKAPVRYPVSCSPQAWAAGAVFMMLAAAIEPKKLQVKRPGKRKNIKTHLPIGKVRVWFK